MSKLSLWLLRRIVKEALARQRLKYVVRVVVEEASAYYNETNQPTLRAHLTDMLNDEVNREWTEYH